MKKGVFDELKDNFLKDGKSLEKPYKAYKESLKLFGFEDFSLSKSINDSSSKIKDVSENSSDEDIDLDEFDKKRKMDEIRRLTNNKHWWNKRNHEPRKGILSDDEILKYAGDSVAASEIRLKRGIGSYSDKTNVNQDNTLLIFGWFAILYFGMMLFIGIIGESIFGLPLVYSIILLILFFILLAGMVYYTIYLFYIKDYTSLEYKKQHGEKKVYDNKNSRDEQAEKVFFFMNMKKLLVIWKNCIKLKRN